MIEDLSFLEETQYTQRDETIDKARQELTESKRTPWGAISEYVEQLRFDESDKEELFRKRTASQIIKSGFVTGCSDVALAFITLARAQGIPTKWVETLEESWVINPSNGISGHIFTDIFINGKWNSYEPRRGFIEEGYKLGKRNYLEVGKGLDFSQLYILENGVYSTTPKEVVTYREIRSLLDSAKTNL